MIGAFVEFIKERKTVALVDLPAEFGLRVQVTPPQGPLRHTPPPPPPSPLPAHAPLVPNVMHTVNSHDCSRVFHRIVWLGAC